MKITPYLIILLLLTTQAIAKPNIVLFMADDLTYTDLGTYGGQAETPNLDQFAKEGMKFSRAYQATAVCSPTRQNLLTGMWPVRNGAYPQTAYIYKHVKTLPQYFKELGYRVGIVGKRHFYPEKQYPFEYLTKDKKMDFEAADKFLTSVGDQPFFLFVATPEPHFPWTKTTGKTYSGPDLKLPKNWVDTPETRTAYANYLGEVTYQDWEFGEVIKLLKKHKKYDNSAVFYTSEQGASFPYAKWTTYESGVHTGFVARWPNKIPAGVTNNAIVEYTDFLPTFLDMADGKIAKAIDGVSFKENLLTNSQKSKPYTFSMHTLRGEPWGGEYFGVRTIRDDRFTFIHNLHPDMLFEQHLTRYGDGFFNSWRHKAWHDVEANKLFLRYIKHPEFELYDREADPMELNNLANDPKYAKTMKKLKKELKRWMKKNGDKGHETEMAALERQAKDKLPKEGDLW